jgi:hypothetical protein
MDKNNTRLPWIADGLGGADAPLVGSACTTDFNTVCRRNELEWLCNPACRELTGTKKGGRWPVEALLRRMTVVAIS